MAWLDDLKTLCVEGGLSAARIKVSSKDAIPADDEPSISIVETGGTAPEYRQNLDLPAYESPSAQVLARGASYIAARAMLTTAFNSICKVKNRTVNGVWYVKIRPLSSKFTDLLPDERGRARVAFNVLGEKRP